jgi:hypothetical protein
MPNGSPGDDPYTDVVVHGLEVYSSHATALIREIAELADERTRRVVLGGLFGKYHPMLKPNIAALEQELTHLRDRLLAEARERGFSVPEDK